MKNTSATGGFLSQTSLAVLEDDALLDFLQEWIVGVLGGAISEFNVRPRWQPEPPNLPAENVDWMAFGITREEADTYAADLHHGDENNGHDELRRHETLHLLCSFYGPNRRDCAKRLRDGIQIPQNREFLIPQNIALIETGNLIAAPELVKERWLHRVDMPISLRRQITRIYAVKTILSAEGELDNEHYVTPIVS